MKKERNSIVFDEKRKKFDRFWWKKKEIRSFLMKKERNSIGQQLSRHLCFQVKLCLDLCAADVFSFFMVDWKGKMRPILLAKIEP